HCPSCRQLIEGIASPYPAIVQCPLCGKSSPVEQVGTVAWNANGPAQGNDRSRTLSSQEQQEETIARQSLNSQQPRSTSDSGTETSRTPSTDDSQPTTVWYYARNRVKYGPYRFDQLQEIARLGNITPADMVLQEGSRRWVPASSL